MFTSRKSARLNELLTIDVIIRLVKSCRAKKITSKKYQLSFTLKLIKVIHCN